MQRLFKCQSYFMTLLVAVLFIVGTATSDDPAVSIPKKYVMSSAIVKTPIVL